MKKWIAGLCILVLAAGLTLPVFAREDDTAENSFNTGLLAPVLLDPLQILSASEVDHLNEVMGSYAPQEETLLINEAPMFYYYEQLEPYEQEMYDIMLNIAMDPVKENIGVMMTDKDPQSDEFFVSFCTAYNAMVYDHPELFWLYQSIEDSMQYMSDVIIKNGIYIVYFQLIETYENYEKRMTEFNQAAAKFLADIDRNASDFDIIRQIHDKLINLVSYNTPVSANASEGKNLAHTAYGALVQDSYGNPNKPVCDGYSLAFEYLLQQCGIKASFLCGDAGSNPFTAGGHAWSIVQLDGQWFEVDSTWDDSWNDYEDDGGDFYYETMQALGDPSYRYKLEHYLFLISTDKMTNYVADQNYFTYYFNDGSYIWFTPDSVHLRWTNTDGRFESNPAQKAVNGLMDKAPIAQFDYIY